jgi:hypothetical protein
VGWADANPAIDPASNKAQSDAKYFIDSLYRLPYLGVFALRLNRVIEDSMSFGQKDQEN